MCVCVLCVVCCMLCCVVPCICCVVEGPDPLAHLRGIRLSSLLGKLIERLATDEIFPMNGPTSALICPEQYACKQGISSDMAALLLASWIEMRSNIPTYVLFSDISGAYDNVWREALWAKIRSKLTTDRARGCSIKVHHLKALYNKMRSYVRGLRSLSERIDCFKGVGQGSPNSGNLFCVFMSDLPDDLKKLIDPAELYGVLVSCLIFMDDIAIPLTTPDEVRQALLTLHTYGKKWGVEFSLRKTRVLCFRARPSHNVAIWSVSPDSVS